MKLGQLSSFRSDDCRKGSWLSSGSDSEDSEEEQDSSSLPSAVEEPIRELIQQQLETFAADKTVSCVVACMLFLVLLHAILRPTCVSTSSDWRHVLRS